MDKLIVYPDGTDKPGETFDVANGFVSRVVGAVADVNIPDAHEACKILNAHVAEQGGVTREFLDKSAKAAIRALMSLEATAKMLETYAPEIFPKTNEHGQIHFGRVMMEAAAESIREAFANAIKQVEGPITPAAVTAALAKAPAL